VTEYYCTYFDSNYLVKALAMLSSLERQEKHEYRVFAVCMDELARLLLTRLDLPNVTAIPIHEIEERDLPLLHAKLDRTMVEYYWTTTPAVMLWILDHFPEVGVLNYVDADLFFFGNTKSMRRELGDGSILIHPHRFSPQLAHLEVHGKYNVGWISARNDEPAHEVLTKWREQCIEWCKHDAVDGKCGDQKYLDDWPERYECVRVSQNIGAGVGPWSHAQYKFKSDPNGGVQINGVHLIFYHFHSLVIVHPYVILPTKHAVYPLTEELLRCCFLPYTRALSTHMARVFDVLPGFDCGLYDAELWTAQNTVLARKDTVPALHKEGMPATLKPLDEEWQYFPGAQLR